MKSNLKEIFSDDLQMLQILEEREQTEALNDQKLLLKELVKEKAVQDSVEKRVKIEFLKGEDGHTPTPEEILGLFQQYAPKVKDGKDGLPGRDGKSIVGPIGLKGEKGESIKGEAGKDGKSVTVDEVITRLKSLKGDEAEAFGKTIGKMIDISQIRNAQSFMFNGKRIKFEELLHGGGSSSSSSSGYQVPTGTVNSVNKIFTFVTAPNVVVVDGISLNQTAQDGQVNWSGTNVITLTLAPNQSIFATA